MPHSLHYKLFDKRRNNPKFALTMAFPPMDSILADPSKYSVLRSQMFRFDCNCSFAADFIHNTTELALMMISQGYNKRRLVSQIRKYDRQLGQEQRKVATCQPQDHRHDQRSHTRHQNQHIARVTMLAHHHYTLHLTHTTKHSTPETIATTEEPANPASASACIVLTQ